MLKQQAHIFEVAPSETHAGVIRLVGSPEASYHNLQQAAQNVRLVEGASLKSTDALLQQATRKALKAKVTSRTGNKPRLVAIVGHLDLILPALKRVCPDEQKRADRRPWQYAMS